MHCYQNNHEEIGVTWIGSHFRGIAADDKPKLI
jgi:hypothetical protein